MILYANYFNLVTKKKKKEFQQRIATNFKTQTKTDKTAS
jgi:hypothetical protein